MRTLKKALSLVLVLAMVFALAVPGFAANTAKKASDFKDYSKVTNKEAVDVLTAIGVINGNADGTFAPEGKFTRAEAATLVSYLTLGKTVADALPTSATKFSDVPATHWAAKYVQYCADAGIVNGVGNGKFDPDAKLTSTQWALMLLGALGYNAKNEGIGGAGWELATTRLAMKAGVASDTELTGAFNRDMAAKFAFNTLTADIVEYATNGTNITIGDATISTGASAAKTVAQGSYPDYTTATTTDGKEATVQFCEAHFGDLKLTTGTSTGLMRPASGAWTYKINGKTETVCNVAKTAAYTFVATKSYTGTALDSKEDVAGMLNKTLKITKTADQLTFADNANFYVNGDKKATTGTYTTDIKAGDTVEVYVDSTTKTTVTDIIVTRYTVTEVTAIRDLTASQIKANENNGDAAVVAATKNISLKDNGTVYNTKFAGFDYKVGDTVLIAKKGNEVLASKATTTVSGAVSKVTGTTATVAGTDYTVADVSGLTVAAGKDSKTFVVADGFIWGTTTTVSKDYVMVIGVSNTAIGDEGLGETQYYNVRYVDMTGTVTTVKAAVIVTKAASSTTVSAPAAVNKFYTVSDDTTNTGMKKLAEVASANYKTGDLNNNKLANNQPVIAAGIIANANTVFVLKTAANTYKTYTGIANVPNYSKGSTAVTAYAVVDGYASVVYIDLTSATASSTDAKDVIYVLDADSIGTGYDAEKNATYDIYNAIVNGEKTQIKVTKDSAIDDGLCVVGSYDGNGFVKTATAVKNDVTKGYTKETVSSAAVTFSAPALTVEGKGTYFVADDAVVYVIDATTKNVTTVGAADLVGTVTGTYTLVYKSTNNATVTAIYFEGSIA